MEIPLLTDIMVIFALSVAVLFLSHRLRIPAIVGYLVTGVLVGPHGLGLISGAHEVEILAEVGVVLLLFTVGIEFSLKSLLQAKRSVLVGGSLQVVITLVAASLVAMYIGWGLGRSIFAGFLFSLSSTAIVLKLLQERAEVDSPHGETSLAILVFQDVIIVPMMLFTPLLAGARENPIETLLILTAKGTGIVILVIISAKWIIPQLMFQIARTRSRELFVLSIVVMCLAVAWLTHQAGLSFALGAFLAGLIISESEYSHQALSNVLPFRDVFTSFFFVSIGMLLDIGFVLKEPALIVLIALGVITLKTLAGVSAVALIGFPLRTAILVGLALGQIGEFSFILSRTGIEYGLLRGDIYQAFLGVSVVTMAATPFAIALAPQVADLALRLPLPMIVKSGFSPLLRHDSSGKSKSLKDHLIIVGFGVNGRNMARSAKAAGIPYVVIEMNPETVRNERARNEPIHYGDATQEPVLELVRIKDARVLVSVISDPMATRRITAIARKLNPRIYLIMRTRFVQEVKPLFELGADEVIPEEFETSIEIFARVLWKYLVPRDEIEQLIAEVRSDGYQMLWDPSREASHFYNLKLHLPDVEISTLRVNPRSPLRGNSLAEIGLRKRHGVTLLAVRRGSQILSNPSGDTQLEANDVLVVIGLPGKIAAIAELARNPETCEKAS